MQPTEPSSYAEQEEPSVAGEQRSPPLPTAGTILVVDAMPEIRYLVAEILQEAGYTVLAAANGRAALTLLEKHAIDVVLLDLMMPELDGVATLTALRQQSAAAILLLSARTYATLRATPGSLGVAAYLPKPFPLQQLLDAVQFVLQGCRLAPHPGEQASQ